MNLAASLANTAREHPHQVALRQGDRDPREIEEVLYEHPDVVEAAVVGFAHPELGEEVAAAVTLKPARRPPPPSSPRPWTRCSSTPPWDRCGGSHRTCRR